MTKYALSFTAASIRRAECVILARAYMTTPDWQVVRGRCVSDDILMIRLESSRNRVSRELIKRMKNLKHEELELLASTPDTDAQNSILWLAICRTYEFVAEFAVQVLGQRWHEGKHSLPKGVYEAFFEEASLLHSELATLSEKTKPRLRNQLFQMLREMGFIDENEYLQPYLLPITTEHLICGDERDYFPTATDI